MVELSLRLVDNSIWYHENELTNTTDWSEYSAPDIVSTGLDTIFVAAVNRSGEMHSFKRTSGGSWDLYGQIGGNGWAGNQP